jgi:hypothetical protein
MKSNAKSKRRSPHARPSAASAVRRAHKPSTPRRSQAIKSAPEAGAKEPQPSFGETFTPMETGQPDRDEGRGPMGQEGEGEAQNDQLAALEGIEPRMTEDDV